MSVIVKGGQTIVKGEKTILDVYRKSGISTLSVPLEDC
jgi:hypothetical protein